MNYDEHARFIRTRYELQMYLLQYVGAVTVLKIFFSV